MVNKCHEAGSHLDSLPCDRGRRYLGDERVANVGLSVRPQRAYGWKQLMRERVALSTARDCVGGNGCVVLGHRVDEIDTRHSPKVVSPRANLDRNPPPKG